MSRNLMLPVLTALTLGTLLGRSDHGAAWAAAGKEPAQLFCRTFKHDLDGEAMLSTTDRTSEIGQWVAQARMDGWQVGTVDLEISQKPNGFPQGFVQVCMNRP